MLKKNSIFKDIYYCYKSICYFSPRLNKLIFFQTFLLLLSRIAVAFYALALSYFINKELQVSFIETITIGIASFYCFNRALETIISAIHGRIHTKYILPTAFTFIDKTIIYMLQNYEQLQLDKNPVEISNLLNKKTDARGFLGFLFNHISTPIFELLVCTVLIVKLGFGWLGFMLIPVCLLYLSISILLIPRMKARLSQLLNVNAKATSSFTNALEKANLAQSFGTTSVLTNHLEKITEEETKEFKKSSLLNEMMATLTNVLLTIFAIFFFYYGSEKVLEGTASYGAFAAFIGVITNIFTQLKSLSFAFDGLNNSLNVLKLHVEILEKCFVLDKKYGVQENIQDIDSLVLKNYSVNVGNKELFNLNIEIKKNDKLFIVGNSGVGKSSLIKALLGQYKSTGILLVNNKEIRSGKIFSWLPQEYLAIEGTVRFNLLLGNEKATDQAMIEVLKKVKLYDKVQSIGGLDAQLSYRGNNFSGGENQRLSLARCLLSNNPVLLLDEPNSALDMNLEKEIFMHLMDIEKTAIIIVHRLQSIPKNSTILFMKDNKEYVVDTLENLLIKDKEFQKIYNTY